MDISETDSAGILELWWVWLLPIWFLCIASTIGVMCWRAHTLADGDWRSPTNDPNDTMTGRAAAKEMRKADAAERRTSRAISQWSADLDKEGNGDDGLDGVEMGTQPQIVEISDHLAE